MPNNIFISHSYTPSEIGFVIKLRDLLSTHGFTSTYDPEQVGGLFKITHKLEIDKKVKESELVLLILSSAVNNTVEVKDQLTTAHNHGKPIISVIWQAVQPAPTITRFLRDSPQIDFSGQSTATQDDLLIQRIKEYITPATISSGHQQPIVNLSQTATANVQVIQGQPEDASPSTTATEHKHALRNLPNPIGLSTLIISNIVTPLNLMPLIEEQLTTEIGWLFHAIEHLRQIYTDQTSSDRPAPQTAPSQAQISARSNNQLLIEYDLGTIAGNLTALRRLEIDLNNLSLSLQQEARRGEAGQGDPALQSQLKGIRSDILKEVQNLVDFVGEAYEIIITSPKVLLEMLETHLNPLALGTLVSANLVTAIGLETDQQEIVNQEIKWLFSAAANYQQIYLEVQKQCHQWTGDTGEKSAFLTRTTSEIIAAGPALNIPIPPYAERVETAGNRLLALAGMVEGAESPLQSQFKQMYIHLNNLETFLAREAKMGEEGKRNIELQNNIKNTSVNIARLLTELAQQIDQAYQILVTSPAQLLEILEN